jgi:hypothetical protein
VQWIMGCSRYTFYRAVARRKAGGQGQGGSGSGTSMALIMGDGNGEGEAMGCGHFQRGRGGRRREGSTMPGVNAIEKSGAATVEAEGGGWPLEAEDD